MKSKVLIGKHLSDNLPIQNVLTHEDDLVSLLFSFTLQYAIIKA
jgi:hypothetical protein